MKRLITFSLALLVALSTAITASAQRTQIEGMRPYDKSGLGIFEPAKSDVQFDGLKVRLGANFTQQFQSLSHENGTDSVELMDIGPGFNLATANLNIDVQLEKGITLNLITYLSSRHHSEAWVKGGFVQIDGAEFLNSATVDKIMKNMRLKVGHMEINYGDAHFRRTDNGNAIYNPFVGNYIMDAFTTEIGAEAYYFLGDVTIMAAMTNGLIKGDVTNPEGRSPSIYGKLAYDTDIDEDTRLRLSASYYTNSGTSYQTLYRGDRAGSRYYMVMENTEASTGSQAWSGRYNPYFHSQVNAMMANVFFQFKGFELFGTYEMANGNTSWMDTDWGSGEVTDRNTSQMAVDLTYRFLKEKNMYIAGRYNMVNGTAGGSGNDISINRMQIGWGWFVTDNVLAKIEYVNQNFDGFGYADIRHDGQFNGFMIEGTIGF